MRAGLMAFLLFVLPGTALALTPNDPLLGDLWYLDQVSAPAAWDTETGQKDVVVAVIDTGIDIDHPDLSANIWINTGEVSGDGIDNDGNGYIDDVNGWDFVEDDPDPRPNPNGQTSKITASHGTLIAGIIGAKGNNNEGIVGVNWDVQVMPLRIVSEAGRGTDLDAERAVNYAIEQDVDVINLSLVGDEVNESFVNAIEQAISQGIIVVAAIGNDGETASLANTTTRPIYPACVDGVIGVVASNKQDDKADFSNFGRCADIAAPGVDFFGTLFTNGTSRFNSLYGGNWSGTSAAAPVVSGAAALLRAHYPTLTPKQVQTVLQLSVDPYARQVGQPHYGKSGSGRINMEQAMRVAASFAPARLEAGEVRVEFPSAGEAPRVRVYNAAGAIQTEFLAYAEGFTGGVNGQLVDVDQDGQEEILVAPASRGGAHIRWFSTSGVLEGEFFAFDPSVSGGFEMAVSEASNRMYVAHIGEKTTVRAFDLHSRVLIEENTFAARFLTAGQLIGGEDNVVFTDGSIIFVRGMGGEDQSQFQAVGQGEFISEARLENSRLMVTSQLPDGSYAKRTFTWQGILESYQPL